MKLDLMRARALSSAEFQARTVECVADELLARAESGHGRVVIARGHARQQNVRDLAQVVQQLEEDDGAFAALAVGLRRRNV
jgi:hypothetical protein